MIKKLLKKFFRLYGFEIVPSHSFLIDVRQLDNFIRLQKFYEKIKNIDGSIVECGMGRGRTFLYLVYLTWKEDKNRDVWGFDSFEGFPEPSQYDHSFRRPHKGEWSGTTIEDIKMILLRAGLKDNYVSEKVKIIKGFFDKSLQKYSGGPIAFLHIDADLYESYKTVLQELFPYVSKNGVVLFDEYGEAAWPGAKKAVDEYFKGTPYRISYDQESGKYFVVKTSVS
jgi:hypothetical protein